MIAGPPLYFNFARDVVERWARERPDARALWCVGESGAKEHRYSFRQINEDSRRAASFFNDLGIRRGDRVLLITPRLPQWWLAMLGLIRLGAVPIPGTPLLTAKDIRYRLETAEATALITDAEGRRQSRRAAGQPSRPRWWRASRLDQLRRRRPCCRCELRS